MYGTTGNSKMSARCVHKTNDNNKKIIIVAASLIQTTHVK